MRTIKEWETLNSMVPLWQRQKSEVTREEYDKFYQEQFGDFAPPQSVITVSAEGAVTYKALLFIPSQPPATTTPRTIEPGLQLYSTGVMIMDKCADLLPEYFSFVRGVVDSPDLSLNISRELLQHDRQLKVISANLEKKIKQRAGADAEGRPGGLREVLPKLRPPAEARRPEQLRRQKEQLQDLLLFYSSTEKKLVTLGEYVSRMPEEPEVYLLRRRRQRGGDGSSAPDGAAEGSQHGDPVLHR